MIDTSGFYKLDGELLFGPHYVLNANYELRRESKDDHTYPVDGWYWFDTREEALGFFDFSQDIGQNLQDNSGSNQLYGFDDVPKTGPF